MKPSYDGGNSSNNDNAQSSKLLCFKCEKPAMLRCSMCKKFMLCSQKVHDKEWKDHLTNCPEFLRKNKIDIYSNLAVYRPEWEEERKDIVALYMKRNFRVAVEKSYSLVQRNFAKLTTLEKERYILPFRDINVIKNNAYRMYNSFLYYEDYFCNLMLLVHSLSLFKAKEEVKRLLNQIVKRMEEFNFTGATDILIGVNMDKIKEENSSDTLTNEQEIYLRILKLLITISRRGHSLGEFSFFEKYLLDYVEKIKLVYAHEPYIINNTYLLLGNLYVDFNILEKADILYNLIIESNNLTNQSNEALFGVVLCANYNSGLINFVTDRYEAAKQRLETALKIKKEILKEKNDLQISTIYETLAEVDIEYKSYSSSYVYLQKASEARELSNTYDKEFELKLQTMREHIVQNLTYSKASSSKNQSSEEVENEKQILDMLNDCPVNVEQNTDVTELEKFFQFMTKLSPDKIKKLNDDQPEDFEKNKYFPIVFSQNFKNSLTHNQRLALCDLKLTTLTRIKVLKNYKKKISIKNLNYNALNLVRPENNINSIKNLFLTKNILKVWEVKDKSKLKAFSNDAGEYSKQELQFDDDVSNSVVSNNTSEQVNINSNYNNQYQLVFDNSDRKDSQIINDDSVSKTAAQKIRSSIRKRSTIFETKIENEEKDAKMKEEEKHIDYSKLKHAIKQFCKSNAPHKEKYVDDKFLFLLSRQSDMTKKQINNIIQHPEIIEILLDTYIDMKHKQMNYNGINAYNRSKSNLDLQEEDPFDVFLEEQNKDDVNGFIPPPPKFVFPIFKMNDNP